MSLIPTHSERLTRARADLRLGLPVLLRHESGTYLVAAAETLEAERLRDMAALGPLVLAITEWRARTLKARAYDGDLARLALPAEVRLDMVQSLADPAADLRHPMKGPFLELREGSAEPFRAAIRLAKSARLLPAVLSVPAPEGLTDLSVIEADWVEAEAKAAPLLAPVSAARVPMQVSEAGRLEVFRSSDGADEHYAVEIGRVAREGAPLVRLHSACFTGDVLGSLKCDCGPQLHSAMARMAEEGAGVLLYLGQEGRGIGLANKMRAYALQDQGFDTVDANHRLGFEDDERDFRIGAEILKSLGISKVRLLTNNPKKVEMLTRCGIEVVERVPLKVGLSRFNEAYLQTKAKRSGHLL